jgi:hypothetical protein
MPSIFRFVATSGAAASAAALMLHLGSKPAHAEQNHPASSFAVPDVAHNIPNDAFSEGFVGMVGNTPLVSLLHFFLSL